jgi:DNA modification methylase
MVTEFDFDGDLPAHLVIPWVYESARILKPGGAIVNCGIAGWAGSYEDITVDAGLDFKANIVWLKTNAPPRVRHGGFRSAHEMIWISSKGSLNKRMKKVRQQGLLNWQLETQCPNCQLHFPAVYSKQYGLNEEEWTAHLAPYKSHRDRAGHPTEKPDWIAIKYIDMLTQEGDLVVDPFMGSGWALTNAARMGRRYAGTDTGSRDDGTPWPDIVRQKLDNLQSSFV